MPPSKYVFPIEPHFESYPKECFNFIQGRATSVDADAKSVSVTTTSGEEKTIQYLALVIATGISTPCPLFTQATDAATLSSTLETFQKQLPSAKTVVIGGAGPVGVETAGEIAEFLNGAPGLFGSGVKSPKAKITIVCAENKMLPVLRESISKQGERYLRRLGADVLYNTKVVGTSTVGGSEEEKTVVQLSDGRTLEADIYIDATGARPNTGFLPPAWLDSRNRVRCNTKTLRVEAAGPFVYVVGDAGSYTRGGIMDTYDAVPVALTNLKTDVLGYLTGHSSGRDRVYKPDLSEQQVCPIGTRKGIGAFGGWRLPSLLVWYLKGRDYMSDMIAPQILDGHHFRKEGKWKPEPRGRVDLSSG